MRNADKYRANAVHCFRMANKALDPHDEQTWLNMGETWLGMIPERERMPHPLSSSESIDMNSLASLDFGSTFSNPSINLKYSGPSLSISASACLVSISTVLVSVVG